MATFTKVVLYSDPESGRARFRDELIPLSEGSPEIMVSKLFPSRGHRLRESPVGFKTAMHCPDEIKWIFILSGEMEIGFPGGTSRVFKAGDHFVSADALPEGKTFDPSIHGHFARQLGPMPLVTLFVGVTAS